MTLREMGIKLGECKCSEEKRKDLEKENEQLKKIIEEKAKTIKSLENELADFVARIQTLENQNEKLKEDKNKLHAKIQDLEADNRDNAQNIKDLRGELQELLERIRTLENENKDLKDDKVKLLDEIQNLKNKKDKELLDKIKETKPDWQTCVRCSFWSRLCTLAQPSIFLSNLLIFNLTYY